MLDLQPELTLRPDTAFHILLKAREFDAKVEEVDPDGASNPVDDRGVEVLEFNPGDAVEEELRSAIRGLYDDEQLDLVALAWIGRGDFSFEQWPEARENARRIGRAGVPRYIVALPLVSDYLEAALSQLGFTLNDYLDSHLHGPVAPLNELGEA